MIAEKSPVLEKAAARLTEVSEDMHTRHRLESYRLFEMDHRVMIREAKTEGKEEGKKEGRKEGREEGREEIIKLLEQGFSLYEIKAILLKKEFSEDGNYP